MLKIRVIHFKINLMYIVAIQFRNKQKINVKRKPDSPKIYKIVFYCLNDCVNGKSHVKDKRVKIYRGFCIHKNTIFIHILLENHSLPKCVCLSLKLFIQQYNKIIII